ncbi:MAG: TrkH family potassium uptake protein [Alphaproteobacteria bacterium]|nr:MAG: TrkH family potassium uptake protein [Alphaproteobacteria bacterium]
MFDIRPVAYVTGLLVAVLGASMLVPMAVDFVYGNGHWPIFLEAAIVTSFTGGATALAAASGVGPRLSLRQTFLIATLVWLVLPVFAAIPFMLGPPEARFVDAFFEAMSGMTTTGSTVFAGLDALPEGVLLWRSMLQWFGGVGIIVVAMVFLPELRVGGMQIFRTEAFDTAGKILPRAAQIAARIGVVYLVLTVACIAAYRLVGMEAFDAVNHALTTVSTGGFSTTDASFGAFQGVPEYVASLFMVLASLPFVRFVQLMGGSALPLWRDSQVRAFLAVMLALAGVTALYRVIANGDHAEHALREGLFNVTSIMTGTGFASVDYQLWGTFPVVLFFFLGLIGGCAGSTCCSIKIFRYQLLMSALRAQIRRLYAPHGVFEPRYEGRKVGEDVISSVMAFFVVFIVTLGVLSVALAMTGLDTVTALSGAATALANIGPGLGDEIGPAGNFAHLNDTAKWLLSFAMLAGRLELMTVLVLFTRPFWNG